jgi:hypothetical protein
LKKQANACHATVGGKRGGSGYKQIGLVAGHDEPVLILGETGQEVVDLIVEPELLVQPHHRGGREGLPGLDHRFARCTAVPADKGCLL